MLRVRSHSKNNSFISQNNAEGGRGTWRDREVKKRAYFSTVGSTRIQADWLPRTHRCASWELGNTQNVISTQPLPSDSLHRYFQRKNLIRIMLEMHAGPRTIDVG